MHDADRVDRDVDRRSVSAAYKVLVELVARGVRDSGRERGRLPSERA